jgi:hypothetical protein
MNILAEDHIPNGNIEAIVVFYIEDTALIHWSNFAIQRGLAKGDDFRENNKFSPVKAYQLFKNKFFPRVQSMFINILKSLITPYKSYPSPFVMCYHVFS